ncbi:MAG: pyridoxamine 5'-phosphate oxidase family protein [Actinobacteria bacterium]|nr:pyridoxamine 5'-phosphate oxidase family protein [Actinomycetota bacterium]MCG2818874.1 pyridoxamine 5'-phosphate oxidase family protein [Actinomycetes bacterium]MBU4218787.1 pyridoxamine 5'-phosphate oxidase family protein [Actinomycetota bacterium]MBU4357778.1 pyridoxamine 5'-phosphate oxidase family protein [Actinomycetota bacterium]MBU4390905.1 pyridoxamine 5'-phosphate oxidase family protein [Actinomycetota bacterium]
MQVSDRVWKLVNFRKVNTGFLATAGRDGGCDIACISSLQLSDSETMTMLTGNNRTLGNLKENPNAAFITAGGDTVEATEGCRVYLEMTSIVEEGPVIEKGRQMIEQTVNAEAAGMITAFVTFKVTEVRPLIDMGQEI